MYDYNVIIEHIGVTPYILICCLTTSLFNLWPSGLNNVAPMFIMAVPEFHVNQVWTKELKDTTCSADYTNIFNLTGQIHWAGVPVKAIQATSNQTQDTYKWDQCQGIPETEALLQTIQNLLPSWEKADIKGTGGRGVDGKSWFPSNKSCQNLYDDVQNELQQISNTTDESKIGHGYWWGVHKSGMTKTAATEFGTVCDKAWLKTASTSCYMLGFALGAIIFGNMSDIKGRKVVMRLTSIGALMVDILIVFSTNFWIFLGARLVVAALISGCYVATFTYAMEILPQKYRSFTGVNVQAQFAVGYIILGFLSGLEIVHDWHYFSAAIAAFGLLSVGASFYVPESPAWLFAKNRDEEAFEICDDIHFRKTGENQVPQHVIANAEVKGKNDENEGDSKTYTMIDLFTFSTPMALITLNIMYQWLINTMTYYGLTFGAGDLPGSVIFNNTIGGIMEIGSQIVLILLMDRKWCGRKRLLIGLEFIAASTCLGAAAMYYPSVQRMMLNKGLSEAEINSYIQICAMIGKFGIAGSFALIYNYTAELYPAVVRSNGVAIGSLAGRIGGVSFPFILDLKDSFGNYLPMAIFGVTALICTFMSFFFPETRDSPNLQTLEDADRFYKGEHLDGSNEENEKFMR